MKFSIVLLVIGIVTASAFPAVAGPKIEAGTLLVANRGLQDPNFRQTVVLIFDYGAHGTGGVIVNRPSEVTLREAFSGRRSLETRDDVLWRGGPVIPRGLTAIVQDDEPDEGESIRVMDGLQMMDPSKALDRLERLEQLGQLPMGSDRIRIFAGHAGWVPGQLEAEILLGGWELIPGRAEWIFSSDPESLWQTLIELAGLPTT